MKGYEEKRPRTIAIKNLKPGDKFYIHGDVYEVRYITTEGVPEGRIEIGYTATVRHYSLKTGERRTDTYESWAHWGAKGRVNREPYFGAADE